MAARRLLHGRGFRSIHQEALAVTPGTNDVVAGIPRSRTSAIDSTYEELALFGNATWHVTDRFDLSFGGRWSDNDQDASQCVTIGLPEFLIGPPGVIEQNFDNLEVV